MLDYTCGKAPVLEGEAEHAGAVRLYKAPGSEVLYMSIHVYIQDN